MGVGELEERRKVQIFEGKKRRRAEKAAEGGNEKFGLGGHARFCRAPHSA
jgi:hypothetical protein